MGDDGDVVADEEGGDTGRTVDASEQVGDLRLDRDAEGRGRLIESGDGRLDGKSPGDRHPLPLTTGEPALEEQRNGEWRYLEFLQVTSC